MWASEVETIARMQNCIDLILLAVCLCALSCCEKVSACAVQSRGTVHLSRQI